MRLTLDNNGKDDIVIGVGQTDNNSRANSGSTYILFDSLIDDYSGTGNNLALSTASHYNLRIDGAAAGDRLAQYGLKGVDFLGTGKNDLIIASRTAAHNGATSGSVYIISNDKINSSSGTGNNLDLNDNSSYRLRYDGAVDDRMIFGNTSGDLNNDGSLDLVVASYFDDNNLHHR